MKERTIFCKEIESLIHFSWRLVSLRIELRLEVFASLEAGISSLFLILFYFYNGFISFSIKDGSSSIIIMPQQMEILKAMRITCASIFNIEKLILFLKIKTLRA